MTYSIDQWAWRKQEYRRRIGKEKRAVANENMKIYQKTPLGKISLKAGFINTIARKYRNAKGKVTGIDLENIIHFQGGTLTIPCNCAGCGTTGEWNGMIWDHIRPISAGGLNTKENLQLLCHECHKRKTSTERVSLGAYGNRFQAFNREFLEPQMALNI